MKMNIGQDLGIEEDDGLIIIHAGIDSIIAEIILTSEEAILVKDFITKVLENSLSN